MTNLPVTPQLAFIESPPQLLLIFFIIFILFGAKKVPAMAKDLGKGIREFKKSLSGESDEEPAPAVASYGPDESITCGRCNARMKSGTKFCSECGQSFAAKEEQPVAAAEMSTASDSVKKREVKKKKPTKKKS